MQPDVSIVIPVYNGMPYIIATVESVLNQTFQNWELIICNNVSNDDTLKQLRNHFPEEAFPKIRVVNFEPHLPMGQHWNRAIKEARGKFIKLLPSDDLLARDCIELQAKILKDNQEVGFVSSGKKVINGQGKELFTLLSLKEGIYDWDRLAWRCLCAVANLIGEPGGLMFRRELLNGNGDYHPDFHYFVDLEHSLRLLRNSKLFIIEKPLYHFRIHGTSAGSKSRRLAIQEHSKILLSFDDEYGFSKRPMLMKYLSLKAHLVSWARMMIFKFAN